MRHIILFQLHQRHNKTENKRMSTNTGLVGTKLYQTLEENSSDSWQYIFQV